MSVQFRAYTQYAPESSRKLLDSIDLTIADGAFVALVGPSGAGKTTLLRAMAGLSTHGEGEVLIDGAPLDSRPVRERGIGFVFQNYALFRHMTVARNISFGLDILPRRERPSRKEIATRVRELLDLIQLPDIAALRPDQLSGGQRQRVALARALATQPKLLLLDEPFGALDPLVRRALRRWLRDLHQRLGLTIVLVTHDQEEALDVTDSLVVMQDGRIVQSGDSATLDAAPATPFVFAFLGEAIRFEGEVRDGVFTPRDPDVAPFATGFAEGEGTALIRPHEITLKPGGTSRVVPLADHHDGLFRYEVATREASFEVTAPNALPGAPGYRVEIGKARLFRP